MQEFTNTSKEENCHCKYNNECEIQVANNGYCPLHCRGYEDRYKLLPDLIKKHYLKEHNISIIDYDECKKLYDYINNKLVPRIMILVDNINACKKYGYGNWFNDLYGINNQKMYFMGATSDTVVGVIYRHNNYKLVITDTVKLKDGVLDRSITKDIVYFKELLQTFEDEYNQFEKEMYDIIYTHLKG